jgi:hypothetical protein
VEVLWQFENKGKGGKGYARTDRMARTDGTDGRMARNGRTHGTDTKCSSRYYLRGHALIRVGQNGVLAISFRILSENFFFFFWPTGVY